MCSTKDALTFVIYTDGDRATVLDRRDEIIERLKPLGIDLMLTDCGIYIVMCDRGEAEEAEGDPAPGAPPFEV